MALETQERLLSVGEVGRQEPGLDLSNLIGQFWLFRKFVVAGLCLGLATGIVISHLVPYQYAASAIVRPSTQSSQIENLLSASGSLGLGGLTSMLSTDQQSDFDAFATLLNSNAVAVRLVRTRPIILQTIFSGDWDAATHTWRRAPIKAYTIDLVRRLLGYPAWTPPGYEELQSYLSKKIDVSTDFKTSQLTMTYTAEDPTFARNLIVWDYDAADQIARQEARIRANKRIAYLQSELSKPNRTDMHDVLIELLSKEEQQKMMSDADEYFSMLPIERPTILQKPTGPSIPLTLATAALLGALGGVGYAAFSRHLRGRANSRRPSHREFGSGP